MKHQVESKLRKVLTYIGLIDSHFLKSEWYSVCKIMKGVSRYTISDQGKQEFYTGFKKRKVRPI